MPMDKKRELSIELELGNPIAVKKVIEEIDRLEAIVKNYELRTEGLIALYESTNLKQPNH
jgi:hypothetical protein